jgi:NTP pyrophosphatase (non-canonical NTP hydrolase)
MSNRTLKENQEIVDQYISQFKEGYFSPLAMLARLTEELGELAREMNHHYGEKPKKEEEQPKSIEEEMGDLFFVLICLANSLNIDLDRSLSIVMEKFQTRDKDRWSRKEEGENHNG